jgi:hypothetical protein
MFSYSYSISIGCHIVRNWKILIDWKVSIDSVSPGGVTGSGEDCDGPWDGIGSGGGISLCGGIGWLMCVGGGDPSYLRRQNFST